MKVWIQRESADLSCVVWDEEMAKKEIEKDILKADFYEVFQIGLQRWNTSEREELIDFLRSKGIAVYFDRWTGDLEIYTGRSIKRQNANKEKEA